jgi:hypothetical protein
MEEPLRQLHVSEVNSRSTHDPLSNAAIDAFRAVSSLIPENTLVILESPVREQDINRAVELARLALPLSTPRWTGKQTRGQSAKRHRVGFATPETWNQIVVSAL